MEEQNTGDFDSTRKRIEEEARDFNRQANNTANEFREGWNQTTHTQENKKVIAGVLAIVLGGFGVHKFILGYTKEGIIQIVITMVTCGMGSILGLIEGIIYLTKSDEDFYQTYQVGRKPWF